MEKVQVCPECGSQELLFDALVHGPDLIAKVSEVHQNVCLCDRCGYSGEPAGAELTPAPSPFAPDVEGVEVRVVNPLAGPSRHWFQSSPVEAAARVGELIRERRA